MTSLSFLRRLTFGSVAALAFASVAQSAPPPGFRWSDTAGLNGRGRTPVATRVTPAPVYGPAYSTTSQVADVPGTIAIRSPDGTVRRFPVQGGIAGANTRVVINGQVMTAVVGTDGVTRYNSVVPGTTVDPVITMPMPGCR